eukprot:snap_masked-scaffold_2-processed-gene-23.28-mRNA-1 protein AED:0.15 eAED:0.15 QI:0/-1/0/1/-1/1/1/0/62
MLHELMGANSMANKIKSKAFFHEIKRLIGFGKDIIFVDETNYNLFCSRSRGCSPQGYRAIGK